jgi:hypothetical protein
MKHTHHQPVTHIRETRTWTDWIPLVVVFSYIAVLTVVTSVIGMSTPYAITSYIMGYFFILFSLFKLLDLPAFVAGYQEYDVIAKKRRQWGYIYPFIELAIGIFYVLVINSIVLHIMTILLSLIACISVLIKLAKRETFQCVCLGTVFKLPLTIVSLIEYAAMGIMAALMLTGILG